MMPGSKLLVVDSAGSFSDVEIAGQRYMCYHLLDNIEALECIQKSDSEWYRYPKKLENMYPGKLNNMRFFYRLYKKL